MITSVEVLKKIREMSKRTLNPLHRILLSNIASEIPMSQDSLLVLLVELENRGLIVINKTNVVSINLTGYGNQENPPSGLDS